MSTPPFPTTLIDSTNDILDTTRTISELVNGTTYTFYLTAVDTNLNESELTAGIEATPGVVSTASNEAMPSEYALHTAYPNPFNPVTTLRYDLPANSRVRLTIYDVMGREVRTLLQGVEEPGYHQVFWDGTDDRGRPVGSGVYLYRIQAGPPAGGFTQARKMLLLK